MSRYLDQLATVTEGQHLSQIRLSMCMRKCTVPMRQKICTGLPSRAIREQKATIFIRAKHCFLIECRALWNGIPIQ